MPIEAANLGYVAGDTAAMRVATKRIVDKAKEKGIKTVVVPETGHGYQVLRWLGANTIGERLPIRCPVDYRVHPPRRRPTDVSSSRSNRTAPRSRTSTRAA